MSQRAIQPSLLGTVLVSSYKSTGKFFQNEAGNEMDKNVLGYWACDFVWYIYADPIHFGNTNTVSCGWANVPIELFPYKQLYIISPYLDRLQDYLVDM